MESLVTLHDIDSEARSSAAPAAVRGLSPVVIGIATSGRRDVLSQTVRSFAEQAVLPERVVICPAKPEDVDADAFAGLPFPVEIVSGPRGLCCQRNTIIGHLGDRNDALLAFLDDDFLLAPDFVAMVQRLFAEHPDVAMATGHVLADGILGPGLSVEHGKAELARLYRPATGPVTVEDTHNGYGCNMIVRLRPALAQGLRFDDRLPLYAWLEDVDFSRRLLPFGRIVRSDHLQGVHLGSKGGRLPGRRTGYSQIANPLYLVRKRSLSFRRAAGQMSRNMAMNLVRMARPEPWIDRRGRFAGNLLALRDLATGRLGPERILDID